MIADEFALDFGARRMEIFLSLAQVALIGRRRCKQPSALSKEPAKTGLIVRASPNATNQRVSLNFPI